MRLQRSEVAGGGGGRWGVTGRASAASHDFDSSSHNAQVLCFTGRYSSRLTINEISHKSHQHTLLVFQSVSHRFKISRR